MAGKYYQSGKSDFGYLIETAMISRDLVSDDFKSALRSKDLLKARIMMKSSFQYDPSCETFDEMFKYARERCPEIIVPFDGGNLEDDKSKWDVNLMNLELAQIINNFSEKRIDHLKRVVRHVRRELMQPNDPGISQQVKRPPMRNNYAADRGCNRRIPTAEQSKWIVKDLKKKGDALLDTLCKVLKHGTWERDIEKLMRETDELKKAIARYLKYHAKHDRRNL